jgi:hypothetical protein
MNGLFSTIQEAFRQLPDGDWLRFGILLLVLLSVLSLVRVVSRVNGYVLLVAFCFGSTFLVANWVHNRTEPSFLTPVVDVVAPWFPKKLRSFDV